LGKALEEFADFEMVGGHGPDQRDQFFADVFGESFLIHLEGQVVAALRGIFVDRTLEEIEGVIDLALELLLAELEDFTLLAHKYAYIYAYFRAVKSARQEWKIKNVSKTER
jgi:hypothetical protein